MLLRYKIIQRGWQLIRQHISHAHAKELSYFFESACKECNIKILSIMKDFLQERCGLSEEDAHAVFCIYRNRYKTVVFHPKNKKDSALKLSLIYLLPTQKK